MDHEKIQAEVLRFQKLWSTNSEVSGEIQSGDNLLSHEIRNFAPHLSHDQIYAGYGKAGLNIAFLRDNLFLRHHDYRTFLRGDLLKTSPESIDELQEMNKLVRLVIDNDIRVPTVAAKQIKSIFPKNVYSLTRDKIFARHSRFLKDADVRREARTVDYIQVDSIWDKLGVKDYEDIFNSFSLLARGNRELNAQYDKLISVREEFESRHCKLLGSKVSARLDLVDKILQSSYLGFHKIPLRQVYAMMGRMLDVSFSLNAIHSWKKTHQAATWTDEDVKKKFKTETSRLSSGPAFAMRFYALEKYKDKLASSYERITRHLDNAYVNRSGTVLFDNYFVGFPTVDKPAKKIEFETDKVKAKIEVDMSSEDSIFNFDSVFCRHYKLPQVLVGSRDGDFYFLNLGNMIY